MIRFLIGFVSVMIVFYMVGAFISGTLNCALWHVVLKGILAFVAIVLGVIVGIISTDRRF